MAADHDPALPPPPLQFFVLGTEQFAYERETRTHGKHEYALVAPAARNNIRDALLREYGTTVTSLPTTFSTEQPTPDAAVPPPRPSTTPPSSDVLKRCDKVFQALRHMREGATFSDFASDEDIVGLWGKCVAASVPPTWLPPEGGFTPTSVVNTVLWLPAVRTVFYHQLRPDWSPADVLSSLTRAMTKRYGGLNLRDQSLDKVVKLSVVRRKPAFMFTPALSVAPCAAGGAAAGLEDAVRPREYDFVQFDCRSYSDACNVIKFLETSYTYQGISFKDICERPDRNSHEIAILDRLGATASTWLHVDVRTCVPMVEARRTYVTLELRVNAWTTSIRPVPPPVPGPPSLTIASFDFESWFVERKVVPVHTLGPQSKVFSIATSVFTQRDRNPTWLSIQFLIPPPDRLHIDPTNSDAQALADALRAHGIVPGEEGLGAQGHDRVDAIDDSCSGDGGSGGSGGSGGMRKKTAGEQRQKQDYYTIVCTVLRERIQARCERVLGRRVDSIEFFEHEWQLYAGWRDMILRVDPDVITGYNIKMYDFQFMFGRLQDSSVNTQNAQRVGMYFGRHISRPCTFDLNTYESNATGKQATASMTCFGRLIIDLMELIRKEENLSSYSLNAVSAHVLKEKVSKLIDDPDKIHTGYAEGEVDALAEIVCYNLHDTYLVVWLFDKRQTINKLLAMSFMTACHPHSIAHRGQQIRVFNSMLLECHARGYIMTPPTLKRPEESYKGGAVHHAFNGMYSSYADALTGEWIDVFIVTLDFQSLYPSIMRTFNLDYTTLEDGPALRHLIAKFARHEPVSMEEALACFTKEFDGILPRKNREWAKSRAGYRAEQKRLVREEKELVAQLEKLAQPGDSGGSGGSNSESEEEKKAQAETVRRLRQALSDNADLFNVLEALQLACKLVMNSSYGFTGATDEQGLYPCWIIATTVTLCGRMIIAQTEELAHTRMEFRFETPSDKRRWHVVMTHDADEFRAWHPQPTGDDYKSAERTVVLHVFVIYGDTDSIMPKFECRERLGLEFLFVLGGLWADRITNTFVERYRAQGYPDVAIKLEFEKIFTSYLLVTKKRYCGEKITSPGQKPKMHVAGLQLKRRDSALIAKQLCEALLEQRVSRGIVESPILLLRQLLDDMVANRVPLEHYYITVKLGTQYDKPEIQKAAHVAAQLEAFQPVYPGQRLEFAFCLLPAVKRLSNTSAANALRARCKDDAAAAGCLARELLERLPMEEALRCIDRIKYLDHVRAPVQSLMEQMGFPIALLDDTFQHYATLLRAQQTATSALGRCFNMSAQPLNVRANPLTNVPAVLARLVPVAQQTCGVRSMATFLAAAKTAGDEGNGGQGAELTLKRKTMRDFFSPAADTGALATPMSRHPPSAPHPAAAVASRKKKKMPVGGPPLALTASVARFLQPQAQSLPQQKIQAAPARPTLTADDMDMLAAMDAAESKD